MHCEICGLEKIRTIVILPIKQRNGKLDTMACLDCAENSPAYCKKHAKPHLEFENESTACVNCIEEIVTKTKNKSSSILKKLRNGLPPTENYRLNNWAKNSAVVTDNYNPTICILRALATKAMRTKKSIEDVADEIIKEKSVNLILPYWYV